MSLKYGRSMVAIPGPSVVPDRVLSAMHRAMPNIYEGEMVDLAYGLVDELPALARTEGRAFINISNGHGAWQMAICNTMSQGEKILVLESGHFAPMWGKMAAVSGIDVEILPGTDRDPVDPQALAARLEADTERELKAVLMVQTDTSTSVRNDLVAVRKVLDDADHPALLMVDCIASLACDRFEMDAWGIDITVAGCQKGLMMPPGLGFIWASEKALAAYDSADLKTGYFDWQPRMEPAAIYSLFSGTPPISHLFGLREALDMIAEEGLENVWRRHEILAGSVWAAVEAWAAPDGLELNIIPPSARSNAVTTILTNSIDPDTLRGIASEEAGLTLGLGVAAGSVRRFRIGHMGHLNPPMILGTLGTTEAVLSSMGAPVGGSGVAAAAAFLGSHLDKGYRRGA